MIRVDLLKPLFLVDFLCILVAVLFYFRFPNWSQPKLLKREKIHSESCLVSRGSSKATPDLGDLKEPKIVHSPKVMKVD